MESQASETDEGGNPGDLSCVVVRLLLRVAHRLLLPVKLERQDVQMEPQLGAQRVLPARSESGISPSVDMDKTHDLLSRGYARREDLAAVLG